MALHMCGPGILSEDEAVGLTFWQQAMATLAPYLAVLSFITDVMDVINVCADGTPLAIVAIALDVISSIFALFVTCPQTVTTTPDTIYFNFDLNEESPPAR